MVETTQDDPHKGAQSATPQEGAVRGVGIVAIGRNEGARLKACLNSLVGENASANYPCVYVDSGSTDDSVAFARGLGVELVSLDMAQPFTAARARNEGAAKLVSRWPELDYIFFIDGDCRAEPDFIPAAHDQFIKNPKVKLVTGRCREMYPDKSIYNLMCDLEWQGPIGEIEACGGIFMIARDTFEKIGGFNPVVIAAEDDELCIRVRTTGAKLVRIDKDMCWHDANIEHFSQWWKRAGRAGYAFGLVGDMHQGYFQQSRRRSIFWGGVLPFLILVGIPFTGGLSLLLAGLYLLSFLKTSKGLIDQGKTVKHSFIYAGFLVLSKFSSFLGMLKYWVKKSMDKTITIVEYK